MKERFPAILSNDGDQLAKAQRRLLAEERMKDLCKGLGYAVPKKLTTKRSTAENDIPQPTLRFKLVGHESSDEDLLKDPTMLGDHSPSMGTSMVIVKQEGDEDMKLKLATSIHSTSHLR